MEGAPKFPRPTPSPSSGEPSCALGRRAVRPGGRPHPRQHVPGRHLRSPRRMAMPFSTDERWLVLHFEKMLHDNASIIELLTLVAAHPLAALRRPGRRDRRLAAARDGLHDGAFRRRARLRQRGREGCFHVWSEAEIDEVLGLNDARSSKAGHGVTPQGNRQGYSVLHRLGAMGLRPADQEAVLTRCRRMLLMARLSASASSATTRRWPTGTATWRSPRSPRRARSSAKPEWELAAIRAFWAIEANGSARRQAPSVLVRRPQRQRGDRRGLCGLSRAALILHELTMDKRYLDKAVAWMEPHRDSSPTRPGRLFPSPAPTPATSMSASRPPMTARRPTITASSSRFWPASPALTGEENTASAPTPPSSPSGRSWSATRWAPPRCSTRWSSSSPGADRGDRRRAQPGHPDADPRGLRPLAALAHPHRAAPRREAAQGPPAHGRPGGRPGDRLCLHHDDLLAAGDRPGPCSSTG